MTDTAPPPDDEIVSAVLDGEAGADERARVEADPAARARLARFDEARRLVAAPVTVPAAARERAIGAALAEFDQLAAARSDQTTPNPAAATPASDPTPTAPTPTAPAVADELAARRAGRGSRGGRILAAAAAIVVILIGIGAVTRLASRSAQTDTLASSATAGNAVTSTTSSGAAAPRAAAEDGAGVTTTAPIAPTPTTVPPASTTTSPTSEAYQDMARAIQVDLGVVTTPAELRTRLTGVLSPTTDEQQTTTPPAGFATIAPAADCAGYLLAVDPEIGTVLASGTAVYQGTSAFVFAFAIDQVAHPAANGSLRIYAVDAATCSSLSEQTL